GGTRRKPATVEVLVADDSQPYCCLTVGDSFRIVTSNPAWATPPAAAPDTWTADTERTELAAHEFIHLWQYAIGGNACMVGVRWATWPSTAFWFRRGSPRSAIGAQGSAPARSGTRLSRRHSARRRTRFIRASRSSEPNTCASQTPFEPSGSRCGYPLRDAAQA